MDNHHVQWINQQNKWPLAIFNSKLLNYQRVAPANWSESPQNYPPIFFWQNRDVGNIGENGQYSPSLWEYIWGIYGQYSNHLSLYVFSQQLDFQKKTRDAHLGMLVRSLSQSNLPIAAIAAPKNGHDQNYWPGQCYYTTNTTSINFLLSGWVKRWTPSLPQNA